MENGKHRLAKRLRWAGRIIVTAAVAFGGTMLIGETVGEIRHKGWAAITEATPQDPGVLLAVIGVVALAGCILSWRRERPAGILLALTSAALGAHIGVFAGRNHLLTWIMIGLPYLVAGALLLSSWRLSREHLWVEEMGGMRG